MITRELLKSEIDFIQDEYLGVLYRFMKSLEVSIRDLRMVGDTRGRDSEDTFNARKQKFFEFVNAHSFTLPDDYTFNREELHER